MPKIDIDEMKKFFKEELDMLESEIKDTDKLYGELKEHFDEVKKSRGQGSLTFISKQTANIVSAKTAKTALIKELINTKKIIIDSAIKTKTEEENTNNNSELLAQLHDMLLSNKKENYIPDKLNDANKVIEENKKEENQEQYLERLKERMESINNKDNVSKVNDNGNIENSEDITIEEETISEENTNIRYVVDMDKNIYPVDENYNILEDEVIPDYIISFEEDEEGNYIAKNQYGEELEIIELEE